MKTFKQYIREEEKTYKPSAGMASAAKKAIEWKEKHGKEVDAGTQTGWVRARQLVNRDELSLDIVKRMHSFFSRHDGNQSIAPEHKDEPWKDNGYVAWLIWGGDAGKSWAARIVKSLDESVEELEEAIKGKYYYHVTLQKHVPKILKQGIRPLMPSNWVRADGTRYNEDGGIFAFEHPYDAANWGFKMGWDRRPDPVAIVRIKKTKGWEQDPSEDPNLTMGKGKALKRYDNVKASDVVDAVPVSIKDPKYYENLIKALNESKEKTVILKLNTSDAAKYHLKGNFTITISEPNKGVIEAIPRMERNDIKYYVKDFERQGYTKIVWKGKKPTKKSDWDIIERLAKETGLPLELK